MTDLEARTSKACGSTGGGMGPLQISRVVQPGAERVESRVRRCLMEGLLLECGFYPIGHKELDPH